MKPTRIPIVLLAAGSSSRMGKTIKQLLPWKSTTLIEHMIRTGRASRASEVVVVLGSSAGVIRKLLTPAPPDCHIIENRDWEQGLSASIACAMYYIGRHLPESEGVVLMLCDQPLVRPAYLDQMIFAFENGDKNIVASSYGSNAGVPALFGRKYFRDLQSMGNDRGAQGILEKYNADIQLLEPGSQVMDMDVSEDYERLVQIAKNRDSLPDIDG